MLITRWSLAVLTLSVALTTSAATFTVTSSLDSGPGTLRQAILDANASPGSDQIRFAVAAVDTIASDLPPITGVTDIQGPVRVGRTNLATPFRLFHFAAGSNGSTLRDIQFGSWSTALEIDAGVSGIVVERTAIGVGFQFINGDGNRFADNRFFELTVTGSSNQIVHNVGNILKVESGHGNQIGGSATGDGNLIVHLFIDGATDTSVVANRFPGQVVGAGISVKGTAARGTRITANTIGEYALAGILVDSGTTDVTITGNSIYGSPIAIDLGFDGPTPNDPAPDADIGANNRQNYPILTSAVIANGTLTITGTLTSAPLTTYLVELFSDAEPNPNARTLLASFAVTTDAAGTATFTRNITSPLPSGNDAATATATNRTTADTSELSAPLAIHGPGQFTFSSATYSVDETAGTITVTVNRTAGSDGTASVQYATQNGTATVPGDYTSASGTLTFGPGVTTQTFSIPIAGDAIPEPAESFTVTLSNPTGGATLGTATTTVTINSHLPAEAIPTASTWALIVLAAALAAITLSRIAH